MVDLQRFLHQVLLLVTWHPGELLDRRGRDTGYDDGIALLSQAFEDLQPAVFTLQVGRVAVEVSRDAPARRTPATHK